MFENPSVCISVGIMLQLEHVLFNSFKVNYRTWGWLVNTCQVGLHLEVTSKDLTVWFSFLPSSLPPSLYPSLLPSFPSFCFPSYFPSVLGIQYLIQPRDSHVNCISRPKKGLLNFKNVSLNCSSLISWGSSFLYIPKTWTPGSDSLYNTEILYTRHYVQCLVFNTQKTARKSLLCLLGKRKVQRS